MTANDIEIVLEALRNGDTKDAIKMLEDIKEDLILWGLLE